MTIRIRLIKAIDNVRSSYWLVPGIFAASGFAAGLTLVFVDGHLGSEWLGRSDWFTGSRPEGARSVLSAISSSTITVAGVVFSITLAAVTYASGQHGPRLLNNFKRDRGNQVTLGVFIATFLYCLVVLRSIRSAVEASADPGDGLREAFVPQIAVYGAFGLAIASIAVLVYFVHHVTDTIDINSVIARIGRALLDDARCLPERSVEGEEHMPEWNGGTPIPSRQTGYIAAVDREALIKAACEAGVTLKLLKRPGDFVHAGRRLFEVQGDCDPALLTDACNAAVVVDRRRSDLQDLRYGIDELVEIAARALSPGVNDPFTATACIDWLGAVSSELVSKLPERSTWVDEEGRPRLIVDPIKFEDLLASAFGQLRTYASVDPIACNALIKTLNEVARDVTNPRNRTLVLLELDRIRTIAAGHDNGE